VDENRVLVGELGKDDAAAQAAARLPPWNWSEMPGPRRRAELDDLAEWVADLQQAYGRWVRLPPCWPCHRALREELTVFWYWRQRLDDAPEAGAEEAVRWHQSLRTSAQAWAEIYGGCRHESLGEVDEKRDGHVAHLAATRPYLDIVVARADGEVRPDAALGQGR
jgi:hypothetical protein